jgi:hypothetical protein
MKCGGRELASNVCVGTAVCNGRCTVNVRVGCRTGCHRVTATHVQLAIPVPTTVRSFSRCFFTTVQFSSHMPLLGAFIGRGQKQGWQ